MRNRFSLHSSEALRLCFVGAMAAVWCGCGERVLIMHREQAPVADAPAPGFGNGEDMPVVAIPALQRPDQPGSRDFAQVKTGAELDLTDRLQQKLSAAERFRLVDKRHVRQILGEHAIQRGVLADPAQCKKLGRQLAADYLLVGDVTAYKTEHEKLGPYRTLVEIAEVSFTLELLDVETHQKVWKVVRSGTGRRLLKDERVEFRIDPVLDTIVENSNQDRASLRDLSALADLLIDEATAPLRR
jgi:hypothetical protein